MDIGSKIRGIYIPKKIYMHPDDKQGSNLVGWKPYETTIDRWVNCHRKGYAFVPGDMRDFRHPYYGKTYSHREALWHGTDWLVVDLDADHIDTCDAAAIHQMDPNIDDLAYAICESVSSGIDGRFARWHGIFALERTVTTRQEYNALLWGLQCKLTTMTGANRQPAQPCYGNGRPDAYFSLIENVLSVETIDELSAIGYNDLPALRKQRAQARDRSDGHYIGARTTGQLRTDYNSIKPDKLREFLARYQVPIYEGAKTAADESCLYYLPCPFRSEHTIELGATDTFLKVSAEGKWGFGCFHDHCQQRLAKAKKHGRSGWQVFKEAITCPVRLALKAQGARPAQIRHEDAARVYDNVICPRDNNHRGTALYRKSDKQCVFLCNQKGCAPVQWSEFLAMGVA